MLNLGIINKLLMDEQTGIKFTQRDLINQVFEQLDEYSARENQDRLRRSGVTSLKNPAAF